MPRGRPLKSEVRERLVTILNYLDTAYGYQIAKIYNEVYPQVTQRLVYYHLRTGIKTGDFILQEVKQEKGEYSWGTTVEKTYYILGPNAKPKDEPRVEKLIQTWKKQPKTAQTPANSPNVFTRVVDKFRKAK